MSLSPQQFDDAHELLWAFQAGVATAEQLRRLEQLVCQDANMRAFYVRYMHLCADLHWNSMDREGAVETSLVPPPPAFVERTAAGSLTLDDGTTEPILPLTSPIVINLESALRPSEGLFSQGSVFLSYVVSAAVVVFGLLIGWIWQISPYQEVISELARRPLSLIANEPQLNFVGRVTGVLDCEWSDPMAGTFEGSHVELGRRIGLASGLLELTYDSGAKILLQGPCQYEVDSTDGGFLSHGKLTALVEQTKAERRNASASPQALPLRPVSITPAAVSPVKMRRSLLAARPAALFAIRTPTAVVTDLGTEFAVEVDENGSSRAHVFCGKAEMRWRDASAASETKIALAENESACIALDPGKTARLRRELLQPDQFTRQMPKRLRIKLNNTGVDVNVGDPDPHWQFVARSDQPNFTPRPARVVAVDPSVRLPNEPSRSQWISLEPVLTLLPDDVVFTLRTTFELKGMSPKSAVLWGRFLVDDHVRAIRLNGQPVDWRASAEEGVFYGFRVFKISRDFVEGVNVLEVDVLNGGYSNARPGSQSYMAWRAELEGSALEAWRPSKDANTSLHSVKATSE